jgi:hypothetical protein
MLTREVRRAGGDSTVDGNPPGPREIECAFVLYGWGSGKLQCCAAVLPVFVERQERQRNESGLVDAPGRGLLGAKGEYPIRVPYLLTLFEERRRPGARGLHERDRCPGGGHRLDGDRQRQGRRAQRRSRLRARYRCGTARHRRDASAAPCRGERRWLGAVPAAAHRTQLGRFHTGVRVDGLSTHDQDECQQQPVCPR